MSMAGDRVRDRDRGLSSLVVEWKISFHSAPKQKALSPQRVREMIARLESTDALAAEWAKLLVFWIVIRGQETAGWLDNMGSEINRLAAELKDCGERKSASPLKECGQLGKAISERDSLQTTLNATCGMVDRLRTELKGYKDREAFEAELDRRELERIIRSGSCD